eukprot:CAMPEP_0171881990 /NCGR_PEP_ID=MMETSP0992-20121227/39332_1 /TAXON_ID=483369 /ORGANISM="non described non described, Strain CCMP2098" /LENGTH=249 /DNA_ID=CAMNT_0012507959 /DNA_START=45 /DNA_END=792 /DNA_ORIENTATION=+
MQSDAASSSDGVPGGTLSKSDATSVRGATKVTTPGGGEEIEIEVRAESVRFMLFQPVKRPPIVKEVPGLQIEIYPWMADKAATADLKTPVPTEQIRGHGETVNFRGKAAVFVAVVETGSGEMRLLLVTPMGSQGNEIYSDHNIAVDSSNFNIHCRQVSTTTTAATKTNNAKGAAASLTNYVKVIKDEYDAAKKKAAVIAAATATAAAATAAATVEGQAPITTATAAAVDNAPALETPVDVNGLGAEEEE